MLVTNRQQYIFLEILNNEMISLKCLSKMMKINEKTIVKEINRLNGFFNQCDTSIAVSKKGIAINTIYSNSELYNIIKLNQQLSLEDELLLILFFEKSPLKISILANKIYTSIATINKMVCQCSSRIKIEKSKDGLLYVASDQNRILDIIRVLVWK